MLQKLLREYKVDPTDELAHRITSFIIRSRSEDKITHAVVVDDSKGDAWAYGKVVKYEPGDTLRTLAIKSMNWDANDSFIWTKEILEKTEQEHKNYVSYAKEAYLLTEDAAKLLRHIQEITPTAGSDSMATRQNYMHQQFAKILCIDILVKGEKEALSMSKEARLLLNEE